MTAFLTICALTSPRISVRKSSRRSLQRMPPRAIRPLRRWTPSTRGEHTQISNIGRGSGRSGTLVVSNLNASTGAVAAVGRRTEGVGAHRGVDQRQQRPQRAVVVEAGHGVQRLGDLRRAASCSACRRRRRRAGSKRVANNADEQRG